MIDWGSGDAVDNKSNPNARGGGVWKWGGSERRQAPSEGSGGRGGGG